MLFWIMLLWAGVSTALGQAGGGGARPGSAVIQVPASGRQSTGSAAAVQTPVSGGTSTVSTITGGIQVQGAYQGSRPLPGQPVSAIQISLSEAIRMGLENNLGAIGLDAALQQARGRTKVVRSSLLPQIETNLRGVLLQTNLQAMGVRFPGAPTIVGPFNYFDLRASLTQTVADFTARHNLKAAQATAEAAEDLAGDAHDTIVLAVAGTYLQIGATEARIEAARAQIETAGTLVRQRRERQEAGVLARIDVQRNEILLRTQEQRLNLARLIGLPVETRIELAEKMQFTPLPAITIEEALARAVESRSDLDAAEAQVRAADEALRAAKAQRLPALAVAGDYGVIGVNPAQSHGTFTLSGTLRIPVFSGGRINGAIEQAQAALELRRAELADLRGQIDAEVRAVFLDLETAAAQREVASENQQVTRETLDLARQRYEAGIADSLEVVQAQEAIVNADQDYVASVFAHNLAKVSLARALGDAQRQLDLFLQRP